MKIRFLLILALLLHVYNAHAFTLVSDIDDTIKISHVKSIPAAIAHAPLTQAFTGMSEVYQALKTSGAASEFYYLSGSSHLLGHHLRRFLSKHEFPAGDTILRYMGIAHDVGMYKIIMLRELLNTISDSVVLIGDDTESDGAAFAQISREFPGRVQAIYIHEVTGKPMTAETVEAGGVKFMTSMDLAVLLYQKAQITRDDVSSLGTLLLSDHTHRMVSHYQNCPAEMSTLRTNDVVLDDLIAKVQGKAMTLCDRD